MSLWSMHSECQQVSPKEKEDPRKFKAFARWRARYYISLEEDHRHTCYFYFSSLLQICTARPPPGERIFHYSFPPGDVLGNCMKRLLHSLCS